MSLVEYPDSDDEQHTARTQTHLRPAKKRKLKHRSSKKLPPLPSSFNDLYPASARIANTDDPDLHGGRIRSVPHVQGNWSAHVYLEWFPSVEAAETLDSFIRTLEACDDGSPQGARIKSLVTDDLGVARPLHVSLSAPLILQRENKDEFLDSMSKALGVVANNILGTLTPEPKEFAWHANAEGSRHFLVMKLGRSDTMWQLLHASNDVAARYGCQKLYDREVEDDKDCPFHVSIGWTLRRPESSVPLGKDGVLGPPLDAIAKGLESWGKINIPIDMIKIRLGQDITSIPFRNTTQ